MQGTRCLPCPCRQILRLLVPFYRLGGCAENGAPSSFYADVVFTFTPFLKLIVSFLRPNVSILLLPNTVVIIKANEPSGRRFLHNRVRPVPGQLCCVCAFGKHYVPVLENTLVAKKITAGVCTPAVIVMGPLKRYFFR